eukprot:11722044-Ditylum_brightwellii.AAC.1
MQIQQKIKVNIDLLYDKCSPNVDDGQTEVSFGGEEFEVENKDGKEDERKTGKMLLTGLLKYKYNKMRKAMVDHGAK